MKRLVLLSLMAAAAAPVAAMAQPAPPAAPPVAGVRLDVVATGEVRRAPDIVTISTGVVSRAEQAGAAMSANAADIARVRAALERAGIPARDIQTGTISLSQDYRPSPDGEARPVGYIASNQLNVRFRDIARAGPIIDSLVAAGANNINGPSFELAEPEAARDEARTRAITVARERADLYARAMGTRVRRIVAVSEAGAMRVQPVANFARLQAAEGAADTAIEPGQLDVSATVTVTFELDQPAG